MLSCESFGSLARDLAGCAGFIAQGSMSFDRLVGHPEFFVPVGMMILGALAIVGAVVTKVVRMLVIYRERIYRIEHGLDPDIPPETYSNRRHQ